MDGLPRAVYRTVEGHRPRILAQSALVLADYILIVWITAPFLPAHDSALRITFAVVLVMALSLCALSLSLALRKVLNQRRARKEKALHRRVVDVLVRIARGEDATADLIGLSQQAPRVVEHAIVDALASLKGAGHSHIARAAEPCGIPRRWRRLAASRNPANRYSAIIGLGLLPEAGCDRTFTEGLRDREEMVAVECGRALIRAGKSDAIEKLFLDLPHHSRLVRPLFPEWLRRHCGTLATTAVPRLLRSGDPNEVLTALEVLASWRRALPLPDLAPLLRHENASVRKAAWRVVPYAMGFHVPEEQAVTALSAGDPNVRVAVLNAVARLGLAEAGPAVERSVFDPDRAVARAAAFALGNLGLRDNLERIAVGGIRPACTCAAEVLEKYNLGRLPR